MKIHPPKKIPLTVPYELSLQRLNDLLDKPEYMAYGIWVVKCNKWSPGFAKIYYSKRGQIMVIHLRGGVGYGYRLRFERGKVKYAFRLLPDDERKLHSVIRKLIGVTHSHVK